MFYMPMAVVVRSVDQTTADLKKQMELYQNAFVGAVYLLGTEVVTRAMRKTPVDTGYLRASRYVLKPSHVAAGSPFEVVVGFSAPYAIFVHERDRNYTVGEWKFLSKAFAEVTSGADAFLAKMTEKLALAGMDIGGIPEVHPTGPLVGPQIHPRLRARRRKLDAQAKQDKRRGLARTPSPRKRK
jgi:hypothetical protein